MDQKKECRCNNCNKLLCKADVKDGSVEIKCSKCGVMNTIAAEGKKPMPQLTGQKQ